MAYFHSSIFIILTFSAALWKKECLGSSNIALRKNTSSTEALLTNPEWNSTTTVDGNTNQNLICGPCLHTQQKRNMAAFLTVDLGKLHTISRIEIYFVKYTSPNCSTTRVDQEVKNRSVKYSLKISNNSSTCGIPCYQDKTNNATTFNLTQSQTCQGTGRYVSIVQNEKSNGTPDVIGPILEVCEFKVFGCEAGMYGPNCALSCPNHCFNNVCDSDNGTCLNGCTDGFFGPNCSMQCQNRTYGKNCSFQCGQCIENVTCHYANGSCPKGICGVGYTGTLCKEECSNGTYGYNCSNKCGKCRTSAVCNKQTGYCPLGQCERGFNGTKCDKECPNGTYGYNCQNSCGHCRNKTACSKEKGECPNLLCERGFNGSLCNETCTDRTYGYNCKEKCGNCRGNAACDKLNGSCDNGLCDKGFNGSLCNKECPNGTHGYNCLSICGECRNKAVCNTKEGECPQALCERGFNGSLCNETCSARTYGYNCNETCGQCRNDTCDTKLGNCTDGLCARGYNGSLCTETCPNGTFGYNCRRKCGNCRDKIACDIQIGTCPYSLCDKGFNGSCCNTECPDGTYGYNCNTTCGTCKGNLPCNKKDGTCKNDECERGLHGSLCKEKCQNGTYGYDCKSTCENCIEELCNIYNGSCVNDGCKQGFKGPLCDIAAESLDQPLEVDNSPYIGGGVAAAFIVVLVVAAVLFLWRRKLSKTTKPKEEQEFSDLETSSGSSITNGGQIGSGVYDSIKKRETYIDNQSKRTNDSNGIQLDQQYENVRLGKPSNKTYEMACSTLADSVKEKENKENKLFKEEFEALPKGQLKPCEAAEMSPNRSKNRFKTTFPYDDTRIVLKTHGDDESDYINANYIKDTTGRKTYIASQGPRTHTVIDMWRMIWQEEISRIVMLTNLQEKRSEKCAKYWPDLNCTITYGNISIKTQKEKVYSNYTIRTFHIVNMKENSSKEVTHYHYTTWPDHSVPESIDLVLFHHKVQRDALSPNKKAAPLLVHCSAGIGRTGTFIALGALLKHCRDEHSVNVFQFVRHMREEERMNMIQTVDQYIAIHYLLLEALRTKFYPIPKSNFEEEVKLMCSSAKPANQSVLRQQISELNDLKPNYSDDDFTRGLQNQLLNVDPNILPIDRYMLYLTTFVKGRNDYINAVTVPMQTRLHSIVVTNHPKDNTTVDLIRLILDHGSCVVEVSGDISANQWYPDPVSTNTYEPFEVERSELKVSATANVTESDITIIEKKDTTRHSFRLFETKTWPSGSSDVSGLKTLCGLVRRVMTWSGNSTNGKIVLISKDGVSRCDVFCAVYNALEQLDLDDEVDMFNIVRQLQIRRPQFIPAVEEYKLCFDAVSHDLESNNEAIYANV